MTSNATQAVEKNSRSAFWDWSAAALLGALLSLGIIAPFFWLGNASGHDFGFHLASWLDAANQWKHHVIYPRWHEWANHGFGEPRFIFYPPLSWMLGAGLGLVLPWNAVPAAFIAVTQTIACLCGFAFARRWVGRRGALTAGVMYAVNPYALLVIYLRSDFAEQLASAFLPLLFLHAFDLTDGFAHGKRPTGTRAVLFALVFAVIWLSNAPAGVLASYTMALLFVWMAVLLRDWRIAARGIGGLALGFGLAGFYLVPAAYEQKWVNIGQALSAGLRPAENFLFTEINDPEHNLFNWTASTIAVVLIVVLGAAAIVAIRETRKSENDELGRGFVALLAIAAAATLLMLRVTVPVWTLLPKLRFVQFPWRWTLILAVPVAFFVGAASVRKVGALWVAGALAISAGTGAYLVGHAWWDANDVPVLQAALAQGKGFEGTDEYDPAGDDHYDLPEGAPPVRVLSEDADGQPAPARVTIEEWTSEARIFSVRSREPLRLAVRLLDYPAWRVEVNGRIVRPETSEQSAQMIVQVAAGTSQVRITFERTADRTAGGAISGVALIAALIVLVRSKTS